MEMERARQGGKEIEEEEREKQKGERERKREKWRGRQTEEGTEVQCMKNRGRI